MITFHQSEKGLHFWDIKSRHDEEVVLINSVKENEEKYSKRAVRQARMAKRLSELLRFLSKVDLEVMVTYNFLRDCPMTVNNYIRDLDIYGVDLGAVKGKTVRHNPGHVRPEIIIPMPNGVLTNHGSDTLCMDIFFVDQLIFMGTISRKVLFTTVAQTEDHTYKTVLEVIIKTIRLYKIRRFVVEFLLTDDKFSELAVVLLKEGILLNGTAANEYVPEIERLIRTIKERHRTRVNTLPCKIDRLPTLLTVNSVLQSAMWLNMFPRKEGVSNTISPHGLIRGRQLDYKVHCRLPFGAYCEVHDEPSPSNTSKSRTTGAIALGPNGHLQGG